MRNAWLKIRNGFLSYSRGDRVGIIVLSILILISIAFKVLLDQMEPTSVLTEDEFDKIVQEWEKEKKQHSIDDKLALFSFNPNTIAKSRLDSFALPEQIKRNLIRYREAGGSFKSKDDIRKLYGMNDSIFENIESFIEIPIPQYNVQEKKVEIDMKEMPEGNFDPNTADVETLKSFGLNEFQAKNIVAYREGGGSYSSPEDLLKIYGFDSATYIKIFPFVEIEDGELVSPQLSKKELRVDINSADTTELMLLNGVGQVYATRIIKYRELLGGFYNTNQLKEVYGFNDELFFTIEPYVYVDTTMIRQIRINFADYGEMIRHPYFNKPRVNAILKEKDINGPIKNISDLTYLEAIDGEFIERIKPYISCR